jgi:hypothetical protein
MRLKAEAVYDDQKFYDRKQVKLRTKLSSSGSRG